MVLIKEKRVPMPEQDPEVRVKNFKEVALGYSEEQAIEEASRCLQCKNPKCREGCPVGVNIPQFIKYIKEREFEEAYKVLSKSLLFPCITGRVCPQENQCEGSCILGKRKNTDPVAIGNLERFIGDWAMEKNIKSTYDIKENGKSVAVIGSGPGGITVASDLRKLGYDVTIFEALHVAGGVLVYGIPEFRLPKSIVRREINKLEKIGVKIRYNTLVGSTISFNDLIEDYDGIYIGIGAGLPRYLNIPGEDLAGVYFANEFLVRVNLMHANKFGSYSTPIKIDEKAGVVGGGNVAMDCARVALRLGAKVTLYYRRDIENMPARKAEIHHALEEGVIFKELTNPIELIGKNGILNSVKYEINQLSEKMDKSGRKIPIPTGQIGIDPVKVFIVAIGQDPNPILTKKVSYLPTDKRGYIIIDPTTLKVKTNNNSIIYAGGDIIGNQYNNIGGTVIAAMGHAKIAAKYLNLDINENAHQIFKKKMAEII
ncbi:MAG: NADPH-dependent glutamate synthase [Promethearchaeota archaeon]